MQVSLIYESLVANQNRMKGAGVAIVYSGHTTAWDRTLFIVRSNASITSQCCNESASLGRLWKNHVVHSGHTTAWDRTLQSMLQRINKNQTN